MSHWPCPNCSLRPTVNQQSPAPPLRDRKHYRTFRSMSVAMVWARSQGVFPLRYPRALPVLPEVLGPRVRLASTGLSYPVPSDAMSDPSGPSTRTTSTLGFASRSRNASSTPARVKSPSRCVSGGMLRLKIGSHDDLKFFFVDLGRGFVRPMWTVVQDCHTSGSCGVTEGRHRH